MNQEELLLIVAGELSSIDEDVLLREGKGKGNWGHKGRPGQVGGSGINGSTSSIKNLSTDNYDKYSESFKSSLSETQKDVVDAYTSNGYRSVNEYLRGKRDADELPGYFKEPEIEVLDKIIEQNQLSEPATLWRGVEVKPNFHPKIGETFSDPAFISTSIDNEKIGGFIRGASLGNERSVIFKIQTSPNQNFTYGWQEVKEIILPRNTAFKVVDISTTKVKTTNSFFGPVEKPVTVYTVTTEISRSWFSDFIKSIRDKFFPDQPPEPPDPNEVLERWVLGSGGESELNCPSCKRFAEMSFQPLGFFPAQRAKTTYCEENCTCTFEYSDGQEYELDRITTWQEWEGWFEMTRSKQNDLSNDEAAFILSAHASTPKQTFFIQRTSDNRYRWFAWPACTAFINRDQEIDSMALFDNFIDRIEKTQEWPYLTFFHQGETLKMGEADFVAREGVAYLVSGLFDQSKLANETVMGLLASEPGYWGTSIRYAPIGKPYYIKNREHLVPVYSDGIHKEVSILPEFAASSIFTAFPIIKE
jgi:hypothetical protein